MQTVKSATRNQEIATRKFNDLQKASNGVGEHNDCSVKAVAAVTGKPYDEAHAELKIQGRRNRKGSYRGQQFNAITNLIGVTPRLDTTLSMMYHGTTTKTISRKLDPNKVYLVYTRSHVSAVVGGGMVDWAQNRCKKIKQIYVVPTPETTPTPAPVKPTPTPTATPVSVKPTPRKRAPKVMLTRDDVLFIRDAHANHGWSQAKLARKYGTSTTCIYNVVNRNTWANV